MSIWQLCANLLIPNCLRSNLSYSPLAALELYVNISNYHIYTLEMLRGKLVFKVDGKVVYEVKKGDIEYWPFDETSYRLMIALSYGGTWAGSCGLADNSLPQSIKVDYVKYYRLKEECND